MPLTGARLNKRAGWLRPLGIIDPELRTTWWQHLKAVLKNPLTLGESLHLQSLIVMQPHDILPNGEQDECDGCPNKTYWNGRLVSECRKEDYLLYDRPILTLPKQQAVTAHW